MDTLTLLVRTEKVYHLKEKVIFKLILLTIESALVLTSVCKRLRSDLLQFSEINVVNPIEDLTFHQSWIWTAGRPVQAVSLRSPVVIIVQHLNMTSVYIN